MLECVKHGFQVCRCPAHTHTHTDIPRHVHANYWGMQKAEKQPPHPILPHQCVLLFNLFLSFFFLSLNMTLLTIHLSAQDGKSSCPWLPSQCLMECLSLWPLAVCLCTLCTCPCLRSNSTTHIRSLSHSVTHQNMETHTCLAVIHTLMHLTYINQTE